MSKHISSHFIFKFFIVFVSLFCLSMTSMGQTPIISIETDSLASIGDQIQLKVRLTSPQKETLLFPNISDTTDKRIEFFPSKFKLDTLLGADGKQTTYQKTFVFSIYEAGQYTIPSMSFLLRAKPMDTIALEYIIPPIKYTITAPTVDTNAAFKEIKPVFSAAYTFREILPWIAIPLAIILLILFIIFYIRKRRKNQPLLKIAQKPAIPANVLALQKLNELHSKKLWQQNLVKEYYTELTDIIRIYIESDLHIATLEKTTDEILEAFAMQMGKNQTYSLLESILIPSIIVKFAKGNPLPEQHETAYKNAVTFVNLASSEKQSTENSNSINQEPKSSTESLNN